MKNINDAGPSNERQAKVDALMSKLRSRGQVGDTSEMGGAETFLAKPPPAPTAPPPSPPPPAVEDVVAEDAVATLETTAEGSAVVEGEREQTTSGIGGTWYPNDEAVDSTHKPTKSGSWGVFERPADISKAYGGGRQIGVGGYQPDEEEIAKKRAETEARLKAYRKGQGADAELQAAHKDEIEAAAKEARQLMRFGATKAALEELNRVRPWLCATTELGSETLLELGMALIAEGDTEGAKPVLATLQSKAPATAVKRAAGQMIFQEEAQAFLKADQTAANDEFAKMARGGLERSLGVAYDKRYDTAAAYLTSTKRPPVSSLSEARMVLRSAAVRRDDGGAPQRISQALSFINGLPVKQRLPPEDAAGGDGDASEGGRPRASALLRGEWLLGLTSSGSAHSFAPSDASLQLRGSGSFESLAPGTIGLVQSSGTYKLDSSAKPVELSLCLEVDSCRLGPLPLPVLGRSSESRVVLLDALMCVTQMGSSSEYTVYVRPSMRAAGEDD